MPETLTLQESMAPEIDRLAKEVQSLRNQTSQLQNTANALKGSQNELARLQQKLSQILSQIEALTNERQQAIRRQDKTLADMKDNQIRMARDVELPKVDNAIIKERQEILELEKKEQRVREARLQQLVTTFQSLNNAMSFVSRQKDYFDKYVWLVYLKNKIGTKDLQPNELTSLSDRMTATKIIETFEREFSESEKSLTDQDKKDIDTATALVTQMPNDKKNLDEMKRIVSNENGRIQSAENELKVIQEMDGYPKEKLSAFKTWGLISLVAGLLLLVFGFIANNDSTKSAYVMPAIGSGALIMIIGIVLLWLRHKNDKEKRLTEATQKLEGLNKQLSQHKESLKALQEKILQDENELEDIWRRRPVLKAVLFH